MKKPSLRVRTANRPTGRTSGDTSGRGFALAGAAFGLLLGLAMYAPASWLASAVHNATAGKVVLADAQGTVWQGNAQLELGGGAGSRDRTALPGSFQWRMGLGWQGLHLDMKASCCTPQGVQAVITPHWGGATTYLGDGVSNWPAALLSGLGTPWNTLQPEGDLQLSTQGLSLDWVAGRVTLAGTAKLDALQISSRLSTLRPMGSYRLSLAGGPSPSLQLETLEGSLLLNGNGQWTGSHLRFQGFAAAAPEREAALANLLNIIGRRDGARSIITVG